MPLLPATTPPGAEIVVTAAREPRPLALSGVSATIIGPDRILALAPVQAADLLRLVPGVAIATAGPLGAQTQVRLRGADANATLVFIDGIASNDPAASAEFLFANLPADGVERIEVLRGPQSALWGSESIGGVIAVTTPSPPTGHRLNARAEAGSLGTYRLAADGGLGTDRAGVSATASHVASDGVDVSGTPGGLRNRFNNLVLSAKAVVRPVTGGEIGVVARLTDATFQYDSPPDDATTAGTARANALRAYADTARGPASFHAEATILDTDNLNRDGGQPTNATSATRVRAIGQSTLALATGRLDHRLTAAIEYDRQLYRARDTVFGGLTNQRVTREGVSGIGEYRVTLPDRASLDLALRHDGNRGFGPATTLRTAGAVTVTPGLTARASYGEGVANPTFTENFGFFPGLFIGNPRLQPERSNGWDAGLALRRGPLSLDAAYFRTRLTREIVTVFDASFRSTAVNRPGRSRRQGVELAAAWQPRPWLRADFTYTWLDATARPVGGIAVREVRRPEHSGAASLTATRGRLRLGGSVAYVGQRPDTDFATFPATPVTLGAYWLATANAALRVAPGIELTARAENAFNVRVTDVAGYRNPGITALAGLRLMLGQ